MSGIRKSVWVLLVGILLIVGSGCMNGQKLVSDSAFEDNAFYQNPLNISGIGDPFVLRVGEDYYCYPTSGGNSYKVWHSKNMKEWQEIGVAYEKPKEGWANKDFWAPEVVFHENMYYMYYTARWKDNQSLRIGLAVSEQPTGPFVDVTKQPLFDEGYAAIDAHVLQDDDGQNYLYYSRDCSENIVDSRHESHIYAVLLSEDMRSIVGEPKMVSKPEQPWETMSGDYRWNEGAFVVKNEGRYYLMYSANYFASREYAIGYGTSDSPMGPFEKYEHNPIVQAKSTWKGISGPGHHSVTTSPDGKELWMVYHTHTVPQIGGGDRQVCIDRMGFREDGSLYVNGPTLSEQLLPQGLGSLKNIAPEAEIIFGDKKIKTLNDGEIALYDHTGTPTLTVANNREISLSWTEKHRVKGIRVYGMDGKQLETVKLKAVFNGGDYVEDFLYEPAIGGTLQASFLEVVTESIVLMVTTEVGAEIYISEIEVLAE